ncbi:hypothetical protein A6043_04525 [[Haemophilus] ducreyi]|nr:hypothetical protein A6043_04525 [[Haemophilus] ducreyi]ANF72189.1 hypothetical protein A6044_04590 [[Haemophilus] ducreyi]
MWISNNSVRRLARRLMRCLKCVAAGLLLAASMLLMVDGLTSWYVKDRLFTDIGQLPARPYAVVLGTAKFYASGELNLYYHYRLAAAAALFQQAKVNKLLVSGDNQTVYYNEPKVMRNDLVNMGVPAGQIEQDFAGFRTLDSIIRAKQVYQLAPFVIVSQRFHCERALFIAKYYDIDAVCFAAKYPAGHIQVRVREFFARLGMLWDLLMHTQPDSLVKVDAKEIKSGNKRWD